MGFGFQAGAQVSEIVIVLNTPAAVQAFTKDGDVTLGGNLSITAGPIGRDAEARVGLQSVMYSYSRSQGVFGSLSVEGTVVATRKEDNAAYYGKPVQARDILAGKVPARGRCQEIAANSFEMVSGKEGRAALLELPFTGPSARMPLSYC